MHKTLHRTCTEIYKMEKGPLEFFCIFSHFFVSAALSQWLTCSYTVACHNPAVFQRLIFQQREVASILLLFFITFMGFAAPLVKVNKVKHTYSKTPLPLSFFKFILITQLTRFSILCPSHFYPVSFPLLSGVLPTAILILSEKLVSAEGTIAWPCTLWEAAFEPGTGDGRSGALPISHHTPLGATLDQAP